MTITAEAIARDYRARAAVHRAIAVVEEVRAEEADRRGRKCQVERQNLHARRYFEVAEHHRACSAIRLEASDRLIVAANAEEVDERPD